MSIGNRLAAAAFLLLLVPPLRAGSRDEDAVAAFAALLAGDDAVAVGALVPEGADVTAAWGSAIDVIERYTCIAIESVSSTLAEAAGDERLLRVTLRGTGVTSGMVRRVEPLPEVWLLRTVNGRITGATSREQHVADAIIAAPDGADLRALIDEDADLARLSRLLAWNGAEYRHGERGFVPIALALEIAEAIGDAEAAELARQMEATQYAIVRRADDAIRTAMAAVERAQSCCSAETLSNAWFTAAVGHWQGDDIVSAIEYFRRAVAHAPELADLRRVIRAHINLVHLETNRGHLSSALTSALEAERLSRLANWQMGQVDALIVQASIQEQLGNGAVAEQVNWRAYELVKALRGRQAKFIMMNLGTAAFRRGDYDAAIARYRAVNARDRLLRLFIACAMERKGQEAEAAAEYECLISEGPRDTPAGGAAIQLSHYLTSTGDPHRALELAYSAERVVARMGTSGHRGVVAQRHIRAAEGAALRALGRRAEARLALEDAVALIEQERESIQFAPSTHADYFDGKMEPYHDMLALLLDENRLQDALRWSDRLKALLLEEMHSGERVDIGAQLTGDERAVQKTIEDEIGRLNRELFAVRRDEKRAAAVRTALADARARWEQLETTLSARYLPRRIRAAADPLRAPEALVPTPDDVLLDFVVARSHTTLFVISRGTGGLAIESHVIASGHAEMRRHVDRFLGRLAAGSFDYEDEARRLYRLLIAPAAQTLRGKKTIGIIADGPLWRLPFQVLQGSDGKPLAARYAVFYAPSLASLLRRTPAPAARPAVLAIGNPRFSGDAAAQMRAKTREALGDLPDAAVEAREIARLYDRGRSRLLTGAEATEAAVKDGAGEYDVLHIAAHAVTDDTQPLYSAIILAGDGARGGDDGILEAREITRLGLRARLAVISACSTAQGHVRPGEGLIGLSWAFLVAGSPTVIASQWRVPSESTSRLMIAMHRELARGGVSAAAALRRAQLTVMQDPRYRHPFYWAGFVAVGAAR